jgi:hypothetical protein
VGLGGGLVGGGVEGGVVGGGVVECVGDGFGLVEVGAGGANTTGGTCPGATLWRAGAVGAGLGVLGDCVAWVGWPVGSPAG